MKRKNPKFITPSGPVHVSLKSHNNHWGVPLSLANMRQDTSFGVFEAGMNHAGELSELTRLIKPHIAIITTVAPVHLGFFRSVDAIADDGPQLYVGGAAGLLGDARGAELEACQHLLDVLERRAAVLELLSDALDPLRTVVRVGPEVDGGQLPDVSYGGATYGIASRSLGSVALLGPLRMDYDKAIRAVRTAAFELSRLVEDVYEDE